MGRRAKTEMEKKVLGYTAAGRTQNASQLPVSVRTTCSGSQRSAPVVLVCESGLTEILCETGQRGLYLKGVASKDG